jgi:alanine racemase
MAFVDCTEAPHAHAGSPVTLIGSDGGAHIGADDLAAAVGTIAYEIVARLPASIPRTFPVASA